MKKTITCHSYSHCQSVTMGISPLPSSSNNILIHHTHPRDPTREPIKKLRRLPHLFNHVLELPLSSDADVVVEESLECFRFVAETNGGGGSGVSSYMVEIHPGVTKILVRTNDSSSLGELELDVWRYRLPESARLDLVTVDLYRHGELVVTVPKTEHNGRDFRQGICSNRTVRVH